jgi:hypothetical protein
MPAPGDDALDLDAELDRLYAGPPGDFVARRDDLAKRLRAAKRGDEAAAVKARRRPTVAAVAVNRVAREAPGEIDALLAAGAALRRAQDDAMAGGPGGIRDAIARRRDAAARVVDHAVRLAGSQGVDAEVRAIVDTAVADADFGDSVRCGRVERAPDLGAGLPDAFAAPERDAFASPERDAFAAPERAEEDVARRREAAEQAEAAFDAAQGEVERLGAALAAARARVAELEAAAKEAERVARERRREVDRVRRLARG